MSSKNKNELSCSDFPRSHSGGLSSGGTELKDDEVWVSLIPRGVPTEYEIVKQLEKEQATQRK